MPDNVLHRQVLAILVASKCFPLKLFSTENCFPEQSLLLKAVHRNEHQRLDCERNDFVEIQSNLRKSLTPPPVSWPATNRTWWLWLLIIADYPIANGIHFQFLSRLNFSHSNSSCLTRFSHFLSDYIRLAAILCCFGWILDLLATLMTAFGLCSSNSYKKYALYKFALYIMIGACKYSLPNIHFQVFVCKPFVF